VRFTVVRVHIHTARSRQRQPQLYIHSLLGSTAPSQAQQEDRKPAFSRQLSPLPDPGRIICSPNLRSGWASWARGHAPQGPLSPKKSQREVPAFPERLPDMLLTQPCRSQYLCCRLKHRTREARKLVERDSRAPGGGNRWRVGAQPLWRT
jgi:hypothetical protein